MAPRAPKWDDEDFDDIWDTENDPARVWGTKEYFNRVDRAGWHTKRDSFADKTQRIKSAVDKDIERIKADAERIKKDAQRMAASTRGYSFRKSAENVRRSTHTHTVSGSFADKETPFSEYLRSKTVAQKSTPSKKKRRFKLSSNTTSGLSIGGILFWAFIAYTCFFGGNDKEEKNANVTSTTNKVVEQAQTSYDNLKPEVQALVDKAKGEYEKIIKDGTTTVEVKVSNNNDPFAQDDNRYESIEDKW